MKSYKVKLYLQFGEHLLMVHPTGYVERLGSGGFEENDWYESVMTPKELDSEEYSDWFEYIGEL